MNSLIPLEVQQAIDRYRNAMLPSILCKTLYNSFIFYVLFFRFLVNKCLLLNAAIDIDAAYVCLRLNILATTLRSGKCHRHKDLVAVNIMSPT